MAELAELEGRDSLTVDELLDRKLTAAGVPKRYLRAETATAMGDYLNALASCGLYIYGGAGTGKTYRAAAICREAARKGEDARFISCARLVMQVRDHMFDSSQELSRLISAPVLVLDDLGCENMTNQALETLYVVIDERLAWERPTVVTSNYSVPDYAKKVSARADASTAQRLASRLASYAKERMDGADRRLG
jgi:DNA replication protein DnaC